MLVFSKEKLVWFYSLVVLCICIRDVHSPVTSGMYEVALAEIKV